MGGVRRPGRARAPARAPPRCRRSCSPAWSTGTPLVTRGAGTGLSGGANAVDGCVVLSTEKMTAITEIDPVERLAVVQPGVVNDHLRAACAEHGLWYPPDPASAPWSTIGGNVATNAGGLCCVKYGVTRDYVLELEVVNGLGEVVRLGRRTAKGVVGYDMVGLMVGSEGTLGVVTEVTVRLRNARAAERTVVGFFDSVVDAGRAVEAIGARRRGALGPRARRPALPGGRRRLEEHGALGRRERRPARPQRHRRRGGRRRGGHDAPLLRGVRGDLRRGVDRRRRGRGAVRRPPARLPGARAARPPADRGRLRAQGGRAGDAGPRRGGRRCGTTC